MSIPAGQRGAQMAPATTMAVERSARGRDEESYRQPENFDALIDGMQRTMLANYHTEVQIMSGLNARSVARIVFSPTQTILRDEQVSADVAQLVLDSDWTDEEKYAFAMVNRERARLWAQMIGIIPDLPTGTVNRLASLSYTTDQYIWAETILRMARLNGALTRWMAGKPARLQEQLATALHFLEDAPPGTKITLTNGRRADDACVEIAFPGPALSEVIA